MRLHEWIPRIEGWIKEAPAPWPTPAGDKSAIKLTKELFIVHATWTGEINQLGNLRLLDECGVYKGYMLIPSCEIVLL